MKADNTTGHSRTIRITGIPDVLDEIEITVNYTGDGNAAKGIVLDTFVIPAIMAGLNVDHTEQPSREQNQLKRLTYANVGEG